MYFSRVALYAEQNGVRKLNASEHRLLTLHIVDLHASCRAERSYKGKVKESAKARENRLCRRRQRSRERRACETGEQRRGTMSETASCTAQLRQGLAAGR